MVKPRIVRAVIMRTYKKIKATCITGINSGRRLQNAYGIYARVNQECVILNLASQQHNN